MSERERAVGLEIPTARDLAQAIPEERLFKYLNPFDTGIVHALWRAGFFIVLRRAHVRSDLFYWCIERRLYRAKRARRGAAPSKQCHKQRKHRRDDF